MIRFKCLLLFLLLSPPLWADEGIVQFKALSGAGVLIQSALGETIVSQQHQQAFMPASTAKLMTAWLALTHWGEEYRFQTQFYFDDKTKTLWVKGGGDPFLISQELTLIAKNLKKRGIVRVNTIGLDTRLFSSGLIVPGSTTTSNPYDASPTALAANFNTIAVKKVAGKWVSAEPQTVLTPMAAKWAKRHSKLGNNLRVNTGRNTKNSERYFAELLAALMRKQGIKTANKVIWGTVPIAQPIYTHENSHTLADITQGMLTYSSNFIANQLVLALAADYYQRPANFTDVADYISLKLKRLNWPNAVIVEGAGLSRDNRLSPAQLVSILTEFQRWRHLMPEVENGIYAKSGTLTGVSTLAGYMVDKHNDWHPFALMLPRSLSHQRRNAIVRKLARHYID